MEGDNSEKGTGGGKRRTGSVRFRQPCPHTLNSDYCKASLNQVVLTNLIRMVFHTSPEDIFVDRARKHSMFTPFDGILHSLIVVSKTYQRVFFLIALNRKFNFNLFIYTFRMFHSHFCKGQTQLC